MKNKILFLTILILGSISCLGQYPAGVSNVFLITGPDETVPYEQWSVDKEHPNSFVMFFDETPVGYKHSYRRIKNLLDTHNFKFSEPKMDNTLLPSWAEGITDYADVDLGLRAGSAEVQMLWVNILYSIMWHCSADTYYIIIIKN